jgi:hypothetical protein
MYRWPSMVAEVDRDVAREADDVAWLSLVPWDGDAAGRVGYRIITAVMRALMTPVGRGTTGAAKWHRTGPRKRVNLWRERGVSSTPGYLTGTVLWVRWTGDTRARAVKRQPAGRTCSRFAAPGRLLGTAAVP